MYGIKWSRIKETSHKNIIIVCTGPSLKNFDFTTLMGKGYIIAVNDAANFVPFADAWFTLDPWGLTTTQIPPKFGGDIFAAVPEDYGTQTASAANHRVVPNKKINYLHRIPFHTDETNRVVDYVSWGMSDDSSCIYTGNSGYGALNMAYHMKPKRIFLFGLDASRGYFFNESKVTRSLDHLPPIFRSCVPQLTKRNIEVINASPHSRIDCFPRYTIPAAVKKLGK